MNLHSPSCLPGPVSCRRTHSTPPADTDTPVAVDAPGVRTELVQRVRCEIAAGTYETPEKLEAALEKLQQRLEWGN